MESYPNLALGFVIVAWMGVFGLALAAEILFLMGGGPHRRKSAPAAAGGRGGILPASRLAFGPPKRPQISAVVPVSPGATAGSTGSELDLSPSEVVFLRADDFSPPAGLMNSYQGLLSEKKVNGPTLAHSMLAAACLALAKSGAARLEAGKKKVLLGLRQVPTLYLRPAGKEVIFPAGSFEHRLLQQAVLNNESAQNVQSLVYQVLGADAMVPWSLVFSQAVQGLAGRGVLDTQEKKGFLKIKSLHYSLPPEKKAQIGQINVQGVRQLLQSYESGQADLWKLLNAEIRAGIESRRESTDTGDLD